MGAAAAIDDHEHIARSRTMIHQGKLYYYQVLAELGIGYLPTQSNFIFLTALPMDAALIVERAAQQNVILNRTDWCDLPDNVRITIARPDENERVDSHFEGDYKSGIIGVTFQAICWRDGEGDVGRG